MKVLIAARLFTGLASSLETGTWKPSGVPAIYKLMEGLAADPSVELTTVLAVKDPLGPWFRHGRQVTIDPVGRVIVYPWGPRRWLARLRLDGLLREISHLLRFLWLVIRTRPDVCYVTNANFPMAAVCTRLRLAPVVMRFLGLHPVQKRLADKGRGVQHWLYQSRFAQAVCSMDGSGGAQYLPRLLHPSVPLRIALNGVDPVEPDPARIAALKQQYTLGARPVVLFVGRLEANKGVLEFVRAVTDVLDRSPDALDAVIVGDGSQAQQARDAAQVSPHIHFTGAVSHADVAAFLALGDIYVSLNRFGSLSNANLEAASAGLCMIALEPDPVDATDLESLEVFPQDAIIRIPRDNLSHGLALALGKLVAAPADIQCYRDRVRACAQAKLTPWDARIDSEIALIKHVADISSGKGE